jgi:alanine racemase
MTCILEKGIQYVIISHPERLSPDLLKNLNYIVVDNTLHFLQTLSRLHRNTFSNIQVIGITGSNGKTIVKDWLSQILSTKFHIIKNPKSYNSQVGVPLSVWKMTAEHEIGVFEAGISKPGEMEKLEPIIAPDWGIFTTLGTAHDEGFSDQNEKAFEKARFFKNTRKIVFHDAYPQFKTALLKQNPDIQIITWGTNKRNTYVVHLDHHSSTQTTAKIIHKNLEDQFTIPFSDQASIENTLNVIVTVLELGLSSDYIQHGLNNLHPVHMRLEFKRGNRHNYLIDDSYNNDFGGLQVALDFQEQQRQRRKKVVILSDILQSGKPVTDLYSAVNQLLTGKKVDQLFGIGPEMYAHQSLFTLPITCYETVNDFLSSSEFEQISHSIVLVKGARPFGFERIIYRMEEKIHETVLEINLNALTNNLNTYRQLLDQKTKIMVMVKAFAYGTGSLEVANWLQFHKVDYLAVAYVDEGIQLRLNGVHTPIMVMNPHPNQFPLLWEYDLEPQVYSFKLLDNLVNEARSHDIEIPIQLKLDTGMHRLGFEWNDLTQLIAVLNDHQSYIRVKGILSHLAASDVPSETEFTLKQIRQFQTMSSLISEKLALQPIRHLLNSAGITRYPEAHMDMVRLGIGLYGFDPNQMIQDKLEPVARLKTVISQIKNISKDDTIGYGRKGKLAKDSVIATIPLGYADGYDRRFSNGKGFVIINEQKAPVIGNVCMDMTMVDITGINASEGDEVIVIGAENSLSGLAETIGTIPYEILTNIGDRVKRSFISD